MRRTQRWTTIDTKITRAASGAARANPEVGLAPVAHLPARGGAVPPPGVVMIAAHKADAGLIMDTSVQALPAAVPARQVGNTMLMNVRALPEIAPAHQTGKTENMSVRALQTADPAL